MIGRVSNRWKGFALLFPIVGMAAATAFAQGPGSQRAFFQAWWGKTKLISAFSPDSIANMAGWWDASDASTISLVAGTNRVSEWRDKSGLDRHFTQTDASERPFYDVTQNGLNAIRTAGAEGMRYETGDQTIWRFLHESKASVFIAMEIIGPQPNTAGPLVVLDTASLSGNGFFITYDNRSSLGRSDGIQVRGQSGSIHYKWGVQNDFWTVDSPQMLGLVIDAANATAADRLFAYDEENTRKNPDNTETGTGTGDTNDDLSFGHVAGGGQFDLDMKIFELIIYSNTVTETERGDVILYLSNKWGL